MSAFPTLSTGSVAMYPLTRNICYSTGVYNFINGSEQRVPDRAVYPSFALVLTGINGYDRSLIDKFFVARKGSFDNTWSITLAPTIGGSPVTYPNMYFVSDAIDWTDAGAERFSCTLQLIQTP